MSSEDITVTPSQQENEALDLASTRRRVEELILWGSYDRAREELERFRDLLQGKDTYKLVTMIVERRIAEVDELGELGESPLKEHLERGQFYFNNFEYLTAVRVWMSNDELQRNEEVQARVAFSQGLLKRIEAGETRVKALIENGDPQGALDEIALLVHVHPKNSRLWNLDRDAKNLLNQKHVDEVKTEVQTKLKDGDYEATLRLLDSISELSQHIATVRWVKKTRDQVASVIRPLLEKALGAGDRARAETLFRWFLRINSGGAFDGDLRKFREALDGMGKGSRAGRTPPLPEISPKPAASVPPRSDPPPPVSPPARPAEIKEPPQAAAPRRRAEVKPPPRPKPAPLSAVQPVQRVRLVVGVVVVVLLMVAGFEGFNQLQLHSARKLRDNGRFEAATRALERTPFVLLGRTDAMALREEVRYLCALDRSEKALSRGDWDRAGTEMLAAAEVGEDLPRQKEKVNSVLKLWQDSVSSLASSGSFREGLRGFLRLQDVEKQLRVPGLTHGPEGYAHALKISQTFLGHGAYSEALTVARSVEQHPRATEEVKLLVGKIREQMILSAEMALSAGDYGLAEGVLQLVEKNFPEVSLDRSPYETKLNFGRAISYTQQSIDSGDFDEACNSYQRAMQFLPHDDQAAFKTLETLKKQIVSMPRRSRRSSGESSFSASDLQQVIEVASRGYRKRLPYRPGEIYEYTIRAGNIRGSWTLLRDPVNSTKYHIEGKINLRPGYSGQATGNVKIGVLLTAGRSTAVAGELVEFPLILPGETKEFKLQLNAPTATYVQLGVDVP